MCVERCVEGVCGQVNRRCVWRGTWRVCVER